MSSTDRDKAMSSRNYLPVEQWHTRELLNLLNSARALGSVLIQWRDEGKLEMGWISYGEVKHLLSTREHIPTSKAERKRIRQEKAKQSK